MVAAEARGQRHRVGDVHCTSLDEARRADSRRCSSTPSTATIDAGISSCAAHGLDRRRHGAARISSRDAWPTGMRVMHRAPMSELNQRDFTLDPEDNARLANLCGPFDEHLRQIELRLGVEINHRGSIFQVIGEDAPAKAAEKRAARAVRDHRRRSADRRDDQPAPGRIRHRRARRAVDRRRAGSGDQGQARRDQGPRRRTRRATCTRSPRTTSTSAWARPAPARPISPSPARSRRWRPTACSG